MHVILREHAKSHVARIHTANPSEGERFYARALLQHRPARSFELLRTINGNVYDTFQAAAAASGLFADNNEGELALLEGIHTLRTPRQLRILFAHLLVNDCIATPAIIWENLHVHLSLDLILRHNNVEATGVNAALQDLSTYLDEHGKLLSDFGLPEPNCYSAEVEHELERWEPERDALQQRAAIAYTQLNHEQQHIFDTIVTATLHDEPMLAFIDGKAGRGKTFLINTICDHLRSLNHIVIPTATSGYAAQLYAGGRTTHSAFKVSVPVLHNTTY